MRHKLRRWGRRVLLTAVAALAVLTGFDGNDDDEAILQSSSAASRSGFARVARRVPIPVAIYLPGFDHQLEQRRVLLHCDQCGYQVIGVGIGERGWPSVRAMLASGEVERIVTTSNSGHTTEPGVEIAGAGRTMISTSGRVRRLHRIAVLVDSGLSDEEIIRILRDQAGGVAGAR